MFLKPTLLALLLSATLSLAVDGTVNVFWPNSTYLHMAADPYERGMAGSWKVFAFTKEETRSFKWYGPRIGDKDERAWKQTCDVSVDKDFNSDKIIEFRLQADAEGLGDTTKREDPKHSGKVTIKCKDAECSLPDGRECKDENVIPHVDLTV